jgi:hypothetical protein
MKVTNKLIANAKAAVRTATHNWTEGKCGDMITGGDDTGDGNASIGPHCRSERTAS